jgi:exonuclease SbcD
MPVGNEVNHMKTSISFIHCADVHLDAPFTTVRQGILPQQRRSDLKKTFEKIISTAREKNVDYLVISGDLYEHRYVTGSTIRWLNNQFEKIADIPCIIIPGNHDPYVANSWYRSYRWNPNVHILSSESPHYIDQKNNVYFYGIGFDTFRQERLPDMEPPEIKPERINVCLFHGTVDMSFTQSAYNPVSSEELTGMGFDYYALGHFHLKQEICSEKGVVNPGSPEPLGFDEQREHGVYYVILEKEDGKIHRKVQFMQMQYRRFHELELDISGIDTEEEFIRKIKQVLECCDPEKDLIKVRLSGRISSEFFDDLKAAAQKLGQSCYYLEFEDCTRPEYDLDEIVKLNNVTGVFARRMLEKMEKADDDGKLVLEKALYLGLDALIQGRVVQYNGFENSEE